MVIKRQKVSEGFKKAIKSDNREIKGYVEVLYQKLDNNPVTFDGTSSIDYSSFDELVNDVRVVQNYATFEPDYFLLDGSFILPSKNEISESGYVSGELFKDIENFNINIEYEDTNTRFITLYFKDNIPLDFKVTLNNEFEFNIENNDKNIVEIDLEEEITISSLRLEVFEVEYEDRRIRIPQIDLGLTHIYDGNDLISFDILEEIKEFNLEIPTNICNVSLNNYDDKFNIYNPSGITKYLNQNCIIKPNVGIVTESNGIEYVSMGKFYLESWEPTNDGLVNFKAENIMGKLKKQKSYIIYKNGVTDIENHFNYICRDAKIEKYDFLVTKVNNTVVTLFNSPLLSVSENLQSCAIYVNAILMAKRDETVELCDINKIVNDDMPISQMKSDPFLSVKQPLKNVIFQKQTVSYNNSDKKVILDTTKYLEDGDYFVFEFGSSLSVDYSESQMTIPSASCLASNYFFKGHVLESKEYRIYLVSYGEILLNYEQLLYKNNSEGEEITIQIPLISDELEMNYARETAETNSRNIFNYIRNNYKNNSIEIEYNGDPSYEPNDCINVETRYGAKNIRILSTYIKFDGGLEGKIKGEF